MGIEPTSDSDCRSTVLKLDKRTSLAWAETAFLQVRGAMGCPLLSAVDPSVPLLMAREWHAASETRLAAVVGRGHSRCKQPLRMSLWTHQVAKRRSWPSLRSMNAAQTSGTAAPVGLSCVLVTRY